MIENSIFLEEISPLQFLGVNNSRFRLLKEEYPELVFVARGDELKIKGPAETVEKVMASLNRVIDEISSEGRITDERFLELLRSGENSGARLPGAEDTDVILHGARGNLIKARTDGQRRMVESCRKNDILFAIGPAGTGKTYTAVAIAVKALREKLVKKIVLCRPAVEAGENLGFLPGDLREKVDPYLRPLYDALEDMLHHDKLETYMEKNIIEIAPLAYMRGRTLSNAFIILDEAQNATELQFKMFLTRLGQSSKIIVTGDDTQVDLPRNQRSGLRQAGRLLANVEGIDFVRLNENDVVRHRLVKRIISAYAAEDERNRKAAEDERARKENPPA